MNRICVGFNLGDGESITDYVISKSIVSGTTTHFIEMLMPGSNEPGRAIPTVFGHDEKRSLVVGGRVLYEFGLMDDIHGNFRHRPCDLLGKLTEDRKKELYQLFSSAGGIPPQAQCPECYTLDMQMCRQDIITFTNAIFEDDKYMERLSAQSAECDEIIFCVGYPDSWNDLDVVAYRAILSESVLGKGAYFGKNSYLVMEMESRAVLRCVEDMACGEFCPKGTSVLVINVGEGGIDITALVPGDAECQYTNRNRYLGAASIDHIVKEMYLERVRQDSEAWERYRFLCENDLFFNESVTLTCRMAKEKIYANYSPDTKVKIDPEVLDFAMRAPAREVVEYIENYPVAKVLSKMMSLSVEEQEKIGKKSWGQLFREFLTEEKRKLSEQSIQIGRIIFAGYDSKSPFVHEIVKEVFSELPDGGMIGDPDPSRIVSKGLALAGTRIRQQEEQKVKEVAVSNKDKAIARVVSKGLALAGMLLRQYEERNACGSESNGGTNMNKIYIGYDLGDGESITDYVSGKSTVSGVETHFIDMSMPGSNEPGRAIPTAFGYDAKGKLVFVEQILSEPDLVHDIKINFKRRPLDLCRAMTKERQVEALGIFTRVRVFPSQVECPECHTPGMDEFRKSVVTFTNAVFENKPYKEKIRSQVVDCEEIVFCVGHPTRWSELDVAIYKSILGESVLGKGIYEGKKSSLIMAAESRAAFLTVKDKASERVLPKGTSVLLLDVGSSTIDITVLTADAHNYQYNSGNNYLGARSIDFIIKKMYLERLQQDAEALERYQQLERNNKTFGESVTLACRMAKEKMYANYSPDTKVKIDPEGLDFAMRARTSELDEYIKNHSVADVLAEGVSLPPEIQRRMGSKNWMQLFREFMMEEKSQISKKSIKVGRIILTGSASRMPFVSEIVKEVFSELPSGGTLDDMNPSRTISKGLALVGVSNDKSAEFQRDVNRLIDKELPIIIENDLPNLAEDLSGVIDEVVTSIIMENMNRWRSGSFDTLDDMSNGIKRDCSEENLQKRLMSNIAYKDTIRNWTVNAVGKDISFKLKAICSRYGVSDLLIENLNIFQVPTIGNINVDVDVLDFADPLIAIVGVIVGIITAIVLPTVLAVVIVLISTISAGLAILIIEILAVIPGGQPVLIGILGVAAAYALITSLGNAKEKALKKMQGANLPQWVRNRLKDEKINAKIKEAQIKEKIRLSILEPDSKKDIIKAVSESLRGQVEKRAESIKYEIESM